MQKITEILWVFFHLFFTQCFFNLQFFLVKYCLPQLFNNKPAELILFQHRVRANYKNYLKEILFYSISTDAIPTTKIFDIFSNLLFSLEMRFPFDFYNFEKNKKNAEKIVLQIPEIFSEILSNNSPQQEKLENTYFYFYFLIFMLFDYLRNYYLELSKNSEEKFIYLIPKKPENYQGKEPIRKRQKITENHINNSPQFFEDLKFSFLILNLLENKFLATFVELKSEMNEIFEFIKKSLPTSKNLIYSFAEMFIFFENENQRKIFGFFQEFYKILISHEKENAKENKKNIQKLVTNSNNDNFWKLQLQLKLANFYIFQYVPDYSYAEKILFKILSNFPISQGSNEWNLHYRNPSEIYSDNSMEISQIKLDEYSIRYCAVEFLLSIFYSRQCYMEMLILFQYSWPLFKVEFYEFINFIKSAKEKFRFPDFINFIVVIDFLEEFMFLLSTPEFQDRIGVLPQALLSGASAANPILAQKLLIKEKVAVLHLPEHSVENTLQRFFATQLKISKSKTESMNF